MGCNCLNDANHLKILQGNVQNMSGPKECRDRMLRKSYLHLVLSFPIWIMGRAQPLILMVIWGPGFLSEPPVLSADPDPGLKPILSCSLTSHLPQALPSRAR